MISRRALKKGARFREIPDLSFWGEDRHCCIRAGALGITLHADTELPPLHLSRKTDLARVPAYAASCGGCASTPSTSSRRRWVTPPAPVRRAPAAVASS